MRLPRRTILLALALGTVALVPSAIGVRRAAVDRADALAGPWPAADRGPVASIASLRADGDTATGDDTGSAGASREREHATAREQVASRPGLMPRGHEGFPRTSLPMPAPASSDAAGSDRAESGTRLGSDSRDLPRFNQPRGLPGGAPHHPWTPRGAG
jgi:hypothetical protein